MKTFYIASLFVVLISIFACQKDAQKTDFKVSGTLKTGENPIANAIVDIDGLEQYKTTTNSEGYFEITNISAGKHSLNTKKRDNDNSFIQKSYDIEFQNDDINFQALLLPNPVLIDSIILDSTTNIATIKWNKSYAEDFREYKLYSHSTSGLDETTGLLEHVTIDINDTVKTIQLESLSLQYFRVFVLNDYGQLGGSNIVSVTTNNINLINGGDFDSTDDLYYWDWEATGEFIISNENTHDGAGCLNIWSEIDTVNNNLSGTIDRWPTYKWKLYTPIELEKNRDYQISFWYKLSGFGYMMYPFNFFYYQDNEEKIYTTIYNYNWVTEWIPQSPFGIIDDTGWLYYSKNFSSDSDARAVFYFTSEMEYVSIDNLKIIVAE